MRELDDLGQLLLSDTPLIDTRAPVEYARGSFPTAVNLPLMTDDEREAVGTCYKQQGPDDAVALGHRLVSGEVKAARIAAWRAFAERHPNGALFCFRGGMRSAISQQWLADAGIDYPRVKGGYKAIRRWLIDTLEHTCVDTPFVVVAGQTGCAKTRLLNEGDAGAPLPNRIDLEGLANHRGSAFGRRPGGQPVQISFENAVAIELARLAAAGVNEIVAEDESRLIGRCSLPPTLQDTLKKAPLVLVEASLEQRVAHSHENYILANLTELNTLEPDPEAAFERFSDGLLDALDRIQKRLGGSRHKAVRAVMVEAIEQHRAGDDSAHRAWIEPLLRDYYDPMYAYQLGQRRERVVFAGSEQAVAEFLLARGARR